MMSEAAPRTETGLMRLVHRLFPPAADFYAMLQAQCELVVVGTERLEAYMTNPSAELADAVRKAEHQGDTLKSEHIDALQRSFSTPMDREDIYRAIIAIDDVLNYAKSTVREMELLELPPDEHTLEMAKRLSEGGRALRDGFSILETDPAAADRAAQHGHKTERRTERIYRRAIAELFDVAHYAKTLTAAQREDARALAELLQPVCEPDAMAIATSVAFVLEILKRREVYRHLSNAADRIERAAEILHDIAVKAI